MAEVVEDHVRTHLVDADAPRFSTMLVFERLSRYAKVLSLVTVAHIS